MACLSCRTEAVSKECKLAQNNFPDDFESIDVDELKNLIQQVLDACGQDGESGPIFISNLITHQLNHKIVGSLAMTWDQDLKENIGILNNITNVLELAVEAATN